MRRTGARTRRGEEEEEEAEELKNARIFWVAGSGGSHAIKVRSGVIECLGVGVGEYGEKLSEKFGQKREGSGGEQSYQKNWCGISYCYCLQFNIHLGLENPLDKR